MSFLKKKANETDNKQALRPTDYGHEVIAVMATRICDEVCIELGKAKIPSEDCIDFKRVITKAIESEGLYSTWAICYRIQHDNKGYKLTDSIYEIVQRNIDKKIEIVKKLQAEWVLKYGVRFKFKEGDRIKFAYVANGNEEVRRGMVRAVDKSRALGFVDTSVGADTLHIAVPSECVIGLLSRGHHVAVRSTPDIVA